MQHQEFKAAIAAILAQAEDGDLHDDALMAASNAVVDLVRVGKLDKAERATCWRTIQMSTTDTTASASCTRRERPSRRLLPKNP